MPRTKMFYVMGLLGLLFVFISGCAFDLAHIQFEPTTIEAPLDENKSFVIQKDIKLTNLPCGYSRMLRKGTKWTCIGTVEKGAVFKSADQSFTLECSNVFEAYLVVQDDNLTGFYLPVQDGFVQIKKPVTIITQ